MKRQGRQTRMVVLAVLVALGVVIGCHEDDLVDPASPSVSSDWANQFTGFLTGQPFKLDWLPNGDTSFAKKYKGEYFVVSPEVSVNDDAVAKQAAFDWAVDVLDYYKARHGFEIVFHKISHTDCTTSAQNSSGYIWQCISGFTLTNGTSSGAASWGDLRHDLDLAMEGPHGHADSGVYGMPVTVTTPGFDMTAGKPQ